MKLSTLHKYSALIIRTGLAMVFWANSYTAFVSPGELHEVIHESFLTFILPINIDSFIKFIGISDAIVGILLLLGIRLKYVASYTTLWIVGVMIVIGLKELEHFLEHFGPLAMAIYLTVNATPADKNSV